MKKKHRKKSVRKRKSKGKGVLGEEKGQREPGEEKSQRKKTVRKRKGKGK